MDATNVTVKHELLESTNVSTAADFLPQDVDENGVEMKSFVFDDDDRPPHLGPSEVRAIASWSLSGKNPHASAVLGQRVSAIGRYKVTQKKLIY